MRAEITSHVTRYSNIPTAALSLKELIGKFVQPFAANPSHRSIVTALWTFILEGKERDRQLSIRSASGGTLEPFLTHLFKGGLIFESILKQSYPHAGNTLGSYLNAAATDLNLNMALWRQHGPYSFHLLPGLRNRWQAEHFRNAPSGSPTP